MNIRDDAEHTGLPLEYLENMKSLLGPEYEGYLASFKSDRSCGLRVNTSKISVSDFLRLSPFRLEEIPYIDNGFYYNPEDNPAKHPYYHAGLYYIQEPSAMLPANRLPIDRGDFVLDLCAAPGGKSTELAAKLNGTGLLFANDISVSRAKALLKNLENAGAANIYVSAEDPEKLSLSYPGFFDKILVDAPCSGEGMFRKDPSLVRSWMERGPEFYAKLQLSILRSAYRMLKKGGLMMYSTCTFSVCENEDVIRDFLTEFTDTELVDIKAYEGFAKGTGGLDKCVRVFPHRMRGEGHFMALIKRHGRNEGSLGRSFNEAKKSGVRFLRCGLDKGDPDKRGEIRPSQAYAMSSKALEYENVLDLKVNDHRVMRYLKGETLFSEIEDPPVNKGYVLIKVDSFALGFASFDGIDTYKNLYKPSWRIL